MKKRRKRARRRTQSRRAEAPSPMRSGVQIVDGLITALIADKATRPKVKSW